MAILNVNDNIASCVPLFESRRNDYEVEVKANGIMYANTAMVKYEYVNCFVSFIRIMKDEEFEQVRESVVKCLGIKDCGCVSCGWDEAATETIDELKTKIAEQAETIKLLTQENIDFQNCDEAVEAINKDLEAKIKALKDENNILRIQNGTMHKAVEMVDDSKVTRLETERDLYKSLYESTLERLIKAV